MKKYISIGVFAILVVSLSIAGLALGEGGPQWSYDGDTGPDHWGDLDPSYAACSEGASQSPINLASAVETELTELEFEYEEVPLAIFNNGHTIEVEYEAG